MVVAQTESKCQAPFSTEQVHLDMARLLSQMNREIELGNDIDLNLLLTRLGNIIPPQDDPVDDNFIQAVLVASVSHAQQPQRRHEPKSQQVDLGHDKSHGANESKMVETLTLVNHPYWIAFSGHSSTSRLVEDTRSITGRTSHAQRCAQCRLCLGRAVRCAPRVGAAALPLDHRVLWLACRHQARTLLGGQTLALAGQSPAGPRYESPSDLEFSSTRQQRLAFRQRDVPLLQPPPIGRP